MATLGPWGRGCLWQTERKKSLSSPSFRIADQEAWIILLLSRLSPVWVIDPRSVLSPALLLHKQEFMKAVTLRSLPPNVAEAIRKEANRKGMSLNKAVISLLANRVSVREKKKSRQTRYHDLDDLAGSWSKKEAAEFDKSLAVQRTIDPDLWK